MFLLTTPQQQPHGTPPEPGLAQWSEPTGKRTYTQWEDNNDWTGAKHGYSPGWKLLCLMQYGTEWLTGTDHESDQHQNKSAAQIRMAKLFGMAVWIIDYSQDELLLQARWNNIQDYTTAWVWGHINHTKGHNGTLFLLFERVYDWVISMGNRQPKPC